MDGIGDYLHSLKDAAGGQVLSMDSVEEAVSRTAALAGSMAARMEESAGKAEILQKRILGGQEQVQALNDAIKNIVREVEQIAEITLIINQISEQTNILSMNAAIESAHAGSAGAGFAVVADEIKKLAELTRENAGRIQEELAAISQKAREALKTSEESAQTFDAITGTVKLFTGDLAEISAAALETSAADGNIGAAIKDSAATSRRLMDGAADIMAHHQSFSIALEQIRRLSEKTRTEIRELHSGTQELVESIRAAQEKFLESLEETEKIKKAFPPTAAAPETAAAAPSTKAPPGTAATVPPGTKAAPDTAAAPGTEAARDAAGERPAFDERGVAVKRPPRSFI
jgi:methyl-accepting chemotaxis protein